MKKLCVWELKQGMYVVDTGLSWLENPHIYSQEGLVAGQAQVDAIIKEGYVDVFVDPSRGTYLFEDAGDSEAQQMANDLQACDVAETSPGLEGLHPVAAGCVEALENDARARYEVMQAEMAAARALYAEAMQNVRSFLDAARDSSRLDVHVSEALVEKVIDSLLRSDDALVSLTKLKTYDEYTYTHSLNVSVLGVAFGKALGLSRTMLKLLGLAGLFHDLGKQRIPPKVLNKPGKLTPEEFEVIKSHPERGHALCVAAGIRDAAVLRGVLDHHEKYNGRGYPGRRSGQGVHLFGRILAVVDVYDALTSKRVYKNGMLPNKALSIMYNMRGEDFFPGMAERFIKTVGIYPIGSLVQLSDRNHGVVVAASPAMPLLPLVRVVLDEQMRPREPVLLDLADEKHRMGARARRIIDCLDPRDHNLNVAEFLS